MLSKINLFQYARHAHLYVRLAIYILNAEEEYRSFF